MTIKRCFRNRPRYTVPDTPFTVDTFLVSYYYNFIILCQMPYNTKEIIYAEQSSSTILY